MPLASDARPGGETIAGKGKGAIRWTAPMVNTRRPEEPRGERRRKSALDTGRSATSARGRARERAASTTAGGGGARVRDLASTTWSPRPADDGDDFNESLVELAEEYERELSFEASNGGRGIANATTSRARVANGADDASRTVIGSMIRRFREAPAAGESPRRRGTRSTEEDDEDDFDDYDRRDEREGFAFSTSQTTSPPERDDARDPLPSDDLVDELIASVSALRDGRRAPFFSASPTPSASSSRHRVGGGANASSEADVSRETWRSSSDAGGGSRGDDEWWFDAPDATDVSTASESGRGGRGGGGEEEEEEDILESWRRRRRLEAATKGAAASPAARAAAAVAALDRVGPVDDDEYQTIVAAARAKLELVASDVESGDAATATCAASAATATTTTTTTATTTEPPREFDPPAWARKVDAAVATSASLELVNDATTDAAAAAESPRARRSLEFESRRDAAKTRAAADDDRRVRERERERDASGAASTSDSDPSSPSSCRDDRDRGPDISDALGNVVGDMLFGGGEDADDDGWSNPGLMMFPSTRGAAAGAKPPRPAPPRPPRSPGSSTRSSRSASPTSTSTRGGGGGGGGGEGGGGLSPIELVAAEVPPRAPPVVHDDATPSSPERSRAIAASAAAAAGGGGNPWLPARAQTGGAAAATAGAAARPPPLQPPPPPRTRPPPSGYGASGERLGEEWAAPSDEDDGLVVMLKARIENLQGQLARFAARAK